MMRALVLALTAGLVIASPVWATGFDDYDFTFTAPGGSVADERIGVFPLTMSPHVGYIEAIELEITGLTHAAPADLDIYLIDPFGATVEIMTDLGNMSPIAGVSLVFNDKAAGIPGVPIASDTYLPEGLFNGTDAGMSTFVGGEKGGGTDAWILLMIDDAPGDEGSFESFTLRGTVPEPMTLSLVAFGALAAVRRRHR